MTPLGRLLPCVLALAGGAVAAPVAPAFLGACDGSATVAVGATHFLSASDNDNLVRLYALGSEAPLREFDLGPALRVQKNRKGEGKEADLEAVARIGTRLYWIGSHGRDRKGDRETSRERLLATELSGDGASTVLRPVGQAFTGLRAALLALPGPVGQALRDAERLPPEDGGLNIEGLVAAGPDRLLIGLRSPLVGGRAIVVPLLAPDRLFDGDAQARLGEPLLLDLAGRGVRAMEPRPGAQPVGFWIVAGPRDASGAFGLYSWVPGQSPRQVRALPDELGSPEGLLTLGQAELWVGYDGSALEGCKEQAVAQRRFRLQRVP